MELNLMLEECTVISDSVFPINCLLTENCTVLLREMLEIECDVQKYRQENKKPVIFTDFLNVL